jgi:isopenicillin-N N-acyltransferase-like protein
MRAIPVHDLAGDARDIGLAHGRLLRDEIRECIEIYRLVLGTGDATLMREAERIAMTVRDFSPQIADEIDAIAEGSGVDPRWVYVLNARSELVTSRGDGCTAVFVPERGLLGQTWDWIDALEPLVVVLRIERAGGHRLLTLTEPGIVAKRGRAHDLSAVPRARRRALGLVRLAAAAQLQGTPIRDAPCDPEPRRGRAGRAGD